MSLALVLRYWWVAAIAALALALGAQTMRLRNAQTAYAEHLADDAIAQAAAANAARAKEQADQAAYDQEAQHARNERKELEAAFAGLATTADGLRDELAEYKRRARAAAAGAAQRSTSKPSADPLDLLSDLFARADGRAGEMARYADALRLAGASCERSADALTR